jgi:excisionase family DNA binding protein
MGYGETSNELRIYVIIETRHAWTTAEAAKNLGCTASWLKEMARRREIPYTMLSGAYHFTSAHLDEIAAIYEVRPRGATATASRDSAAAEPVLRARSPRQRRDTRRRPDAIR